MINQEPTPLREEDIGGRHVVHMIRKTVMEPREILICPYCMKQIGEKEMALEDVRDSNSPVAYFTFHRPCFDKGPIEYTTKAQMKEVADEMENRGRMFPQVLENTNAKENGMKLTKKKLSESVVYYLGEQAVAAYWPKQDVMGISEEALDKFPKLQEYFKETAVMENLSGGLAMHAVPGQVLLRPKFPQSPDEYVNYKGKAGSEGADGKLEKEAKKQKTKKKGDKKKSGKKGKK